MDVDISGINIMGISINLVSRYCNELPVITLPSLIGQNVAVENIKSKKFSPLLQWWFYSSWYSAVKCSVNSYEREMLGMCCVINWQGKETLKIRFYKQIATEN